MCKQPDNVDIYIIGTDGGLIEKPYHVDSLLLTPAERVELLLVPKVTGTSNLLSLRYERGKMSYINGKYGDAPADPNRILASVTLTASRLPDLPAILRELPKLGAAVAVKELTYTGDMDDKEINLYINGRKHDMNHIDLVSNAGQTEEWLIFNNDDMEHNFHIHGSQFRILYYERKGQRRYPQFDCMKDTVHMLPYEKVRVKIMHSHYKGIRMYHCHILEHEDQGMMGQLNVV